MDGSVYLMYVLALLFGVIAGLRTFTAPAAVSWAVHLGIFDVSRSWLWFFGNGWVRWLLTLLALGELVIDQLPGTPSRRVPAQFTGRLVSAALSGAVVGATAGHTLGGAVAGGVGAVIGTLAGSRFRARLASSFHSDHRAAFVEDAIAIGGAVLVGMAAR